MSLDTPYRSPSDAFAATAARRPDAPFLLAPASAGLPYAPEGFKIEYGAFKTEVDRLSAEYAAAGYGRGARVALLLENRPVFFLHWLALNALGVSIVPINPDVRPDELSFQLELSQADLLVAASDRMPGDEGRGARARPPDRHRQPHSAVPDGRRRAECRVQRRMRAAVHLRQHRQAKGLHALEPLFPAGRRLVSRDRAAWPNCSRTARST